MRTCAGNERRGQGLGVLVGGLSIIVLAVLALVPGQPATADEANVGSLSDDFAPPLSDGSARTTLATEYNGAGFVAYTAGVKDRDAYTLRLVSTSEGNVESLRTSVQAAVAQVNQVSSTTIAVASGTVPDVSGDREPVDGEILISYDSTSGCTGSWAGCAAPRLPGTTPDGTETWGGGRIWIKPSVAGYSASDRNHVVAHELGHALGLLHYNSTYNGSVQVMNGTADGYAAGGNYRAGDENGLSYLSPTYLGYQHFGTNATTAVADSSGTYHVFGADETGRTWQGYSNGTGGWVWQDLGGELIGTPTVTYSSATNRWDVFGIGGNGLLYQKTYLNGSWGAWTRVSGSPVLEGGVSAVVDSSGVYHVFGIDSSGVLRQAYYPSSSGDWAWQSLGGTVQGTPGVTYRSGNQQYDVYALDSNGLLMRKTYTGSWSSWYAVSGSPTMQGGVSAEVDAAGVYHVFGIDTSGVLRQAYTTSTSWVWQSLGGTVRGTPGVTYQPTGGKWDAFAVGMNGHLYRKSYQSGWSAWSAWAPIS